MKVTYKQAVPAVCNWMSQNCLAISPSLISFIRERAALNKEHIRPLKEMIVVAITAAIITIAAQRHSVRIRLGEGR